MVKTVGIAGVTGKFSRLIARNLLSNSTVHIRGYCRDPSKVPEWLSSSSRFEAMKGEADDATALRRFAKGLDVMVCGYLGDNKLMTNGQMLLIDACEAENVARYVASDFTIDYRKLEYGELPAKDPMKHVAQYLEGKNVKGVHVLIGVFMETFFSFLGLFDAKATTLKFWGDESDTWESTTYGVAAQYVASVALDDTASGFLQFLGDRKSLREIADTFQGVYGQKIELQRLGSLSDLEIHMHAEQRKHPANVPAWLPLFYQRYVSKTHLKQEVDNSRYPQVKPITFKDFMETHDLDHLTKTQWVVAS